MNGDTKFVHFANKVLFIVCHKKQYISENGEESCDVIVKEAPYRTTVEHGSTEKMSVKLRFTVSLTRLAC